MINVSLIICLPCHFEPVQFILALFLQYFFVYGTIFLKDFKHWCCPGVLHRHVYLCS